MNLYTEAEVSKILKVSAKTLQRKRKEAQPEIPFIRLTATKVRYLESDLNNYLMSKRVSKEN